MGNDCDPAWLSIAEVAARLGVSVDTVNRWNMRGFLPVERRRDRAVAPDLPRDRGALCGVHRARPATLLRAVLTMRWTRAGALIVSLDLCQHPAPERQLFPSVGLSPGQLALLGDLHFAGAIVVAAGAETARAMVGLFGVSHAGNDRTRRSGPRHPRSRDPTPRPPMGRPGLRTLSTATMYVSDGTPRRARMDPGHRVLVA